MACSRLHMLIFMIATVFLCKDAVVAKILSFTSNSSSVRNKDNGTNVTFICTHSCDSNLPPRIRIHGSYYLEGLEEFKFYKRTYIENGNEIPGIPSECSSGLDGNITVMVHGAFSGGLRDDQPCCYGAECTDFNGGGTMCKTFTYQDCSFALDISSISSVIMNTTNGKTQTTTITTTTTTTTTSTIYASTTIPLNSCPTYDSPTFTDFSSQTASSEHVKPHPTSGQPATGILNNTESIATIIVFIVISAIAM